MQAQKLVQRVSASTVLIRKRGELVKQRPLQSAGTRRARRHAGRSGARHSSRADHPDLHWGDHLLSRARPTPERRIFCAAATGADYALLSPSVRRYGCGAPQRRLGSWAAKSRKGRPQRAIGTCTHDPGRNLIAACAVVLAEARADHNAVDGPVLCADWWARRRCQPLRAELARRMVTLRSARCGGSWNGS